MGSILAEQLKKIMLSLFQHHWQAAMFYVVCCLFLFYSVYIVMYVVYSYCLYFCRFICLLTIKIFFQKNLQPTLLIILIIIT